MNQSDDIPYSPFQALVYTLIHTAVAFRYHLRNSLLIALNHRPRAVFRRPVYHDVFYVGIRLREHTLYGISYGCFAVEARGDDRYFHILCKLNLKRINYLPPTKIEYIPLHFFLSNRPIAIAATMNIHGESK